MPRPATARSRRPAAIPPIALGASLLLAACAQQAVKPGAEELADHRHPAVPACAPSRQDAAARPCREASSDDQPSRQAERDPEPLSDLAGELRQSLERPLVERDSLLGPLRP